MSKEQMVQIFDDMGGEFYDQMNFKLRSIHENLHFLLALILKDLAPNARILCVGVGTGADIINLAKTYPEWQFVGIEPAAAMLKHCEEKLKAEGLLERCQLFHGYLSQYHEQEPFDAVLCLYVMHFVKDRSERGQMYATMMEQLKTNGHLIVSEISVDFKAPEYKYLLSNWQGLHGHAGATPEKLSGMGKMLEEQLAIYSAAQTAELLAEHELGEPIQFFQSFLIRGWYLRK